MLPFTESLFSVFISPLYICSFIIFLVCLIPKAFKLEACLKCSWIKAVHWFWRLLRGGGRTMLNTIRSNVMQAADELAVRRKGISRIAVMMDQNKEKKAFPRWWTWVKYGQGIHSSGEKHITWKQTVGRKKLQFSRESWVLGNHGNS